MILGIGRLSDQKDPMGFVQVTHSLLKCMPELRAIWVGDGELWRSVEQSIKVLGMADRFSHCGFADRCEAVSWRMQPVVKYLSLRVVRLYGSGGASDVKASCCHACERNDGYIAGRFESISIFAGCLRRCGTARKPNFRQSRYGIQTILGVTGRKIIRKHFSHAQMRKALQDCYQALLNQRFQC